MMRRREFVTLLGAAAATWPRAADAQEPAAPLVGILSETPASSIAPRVVAFHQGLQEIGYRQGRNVTIDWSSAESEPNRLPSLAAALVARKVAIIVTYLDRATLAAKAVTTTIPIVFLSDGDAVHNGLVPSLDRQGGNVTGLSWFGADLAPARLGLIREIVPNATVVGLLIDPGSADAASQLHGVQKAAKTVGLALVVANARNAGEIDAAFTSVAQQRVAALVVGSSPLFNSSRDQLVALAARHRIPAIYAASEIALAGGLISYGSSVSDAFRRAGVYVGWILKGATPAELPILQSAKFELIVNLKTADALGLAVPRALRAGADKLIE
jgi:putative ABC transport system substrate-binding protein